jgi:hypothetical protein
MYYLKPFAAVFTFVVGTFAAYVLMPLPEYGPVGCTDSTGLVETPVCELAAHPELYDGKLVRVRMNIWRIHSRNASFTTSADCDDKLVVVTCSRGYESCSELLDDITRAQPSDVEIYADGLFSASVISYQRSGTTHRMPLFEITETRSVSVVGGKSRLRGSYGEFKYVDKINGPADSRGTGTGRGHGSGTGDGIGTGPGEGRGSGTGRGYSINTVSGTGPGRGGGGSGGQ